MDLLTPPGLADTQQGMAKGMADLLLLTFTPRDSSLRAAP